MGFLDFVKQMNENFPNPDQIVQAAQHDLQILDQLKVRKSRKAVEGLVKDLQEIISLGGKGVSKMPPPRSIRTPHPNVNQYKGDPNVARLAQQDPREFS